MTQNNNQTPAHSIECNGKRFAVDTVQCVTTAVTSRGNRDFDGARMYAVSCSPTDSTEIDVEKSFDGLDADDLFRAADMFNRTYTVMVSDLRFRAPLLKKLGYTSDIFKDESAHADACEKYDTAFGHIFLGAKLKVQVVVVPVEDLTDGQYKSFEVDLGGETPAIIETRYITAIGSISEAVARTKRSTLAACEGNESTGADGDQ